MNIHIDYRSKYIILLYELINIYSPTDLVRSSNGLAAGQIGKRNEI